MPLSTSGQKIIEPRNATENRCQISEKESTSRRKAALLKPLYNCSRVMDSPEQARTTSHGCRGLTKLLYSATSLTKRTSLGRQQNPASGIWEWEVSSVSASNVMTIQILFCRRL